MFGWFKSNKNNKLSFMMQVTHETSYAETDEVMECIRFLDSAFRFFLSGGDEPDNERDRRLVKQFTEVTSSMTKAQVKEASKAISEMSKEFTQGSRADEVMTASADISNAGVMLEMKGIKIGFPYQGIIETKKNGRHTRIAENLGDIIRLTFRVQGEPDVFSNAVWEIDQRRGTIKYNLIEARYDQIKDYGRILVNEKADGVGAIAR